jgi:thioredoxin reductase (NADPH)
MTYREHPAEGIAQLTGAGVYYGAAVTEANSCCGRRVMVVGGGNSAGQSAVYLSRFASEVHVIVRRNNNESMSHYLVEQIAQTPNVHVRPFTAIEKVEGDQRLERIWLRSGENDGVSVENADALFIFIGTRPHTDWLPAAVLRNEKGFILTGRDVELAPDFSKVWKENREPFALETSIAGLFAAGDVRAGAMNRVASAVGEGAMAVKLVFDYLSRS